MNYGMDSSLFTLIFTFLDDGQKLNMNTKKCIFIGYNNQSKGYKLFDPIKRQTFMSRDVDFIENMTMNQEEVFQENLFKNSPFTSFLPTNENQTNELANGDVVGEENVPDGDMEAQRHQHVVLNHDVIDDLEDDHESIDVHGEDSYGSINDHGLINDHGEDPHEAYHEEEDPINTHDKNPFENNNGQEDPINANGELQIRRGTKVERPSQRFLDSINSIDENEPLSLKDVLNKQDRAKWKEAIKMEYKSLMDKKTWDLVQLPQDRQPLGCKWIFKIKREADGSLDKCKAKLVAKGYDQIEGLDYNETFSPVVRMATMRLLFVISAILDLEL